jgi:hypothetical protein
MKLEVLPGTYAVCRLDPGAPAPERFFSLTRTSEELSLVCEERDVPAGARTETGFRAFRVAGTLDFALTGVLASLTAPLAAAQVSVFALSTFDTDYLLVRAKQWSSAAGFVLEPSRFATQ